MKTILKNISIFILIVFFGCRAFGQSVDLSQTEDSTQSISELELGKINPYWLTVTYDKTTHLIFPSKIRYVDLGSDYLIAGKAEDAENVLRIKASVRDFEPETNFSVITDDGHFYSFDAFYSPFPYSLNFDIRKMEESGSKNEIDDVLFEEMGTHSPSLADLLMKTLYNRDKRILRHIGSKSYGIRFLLKGIYTHNGKFYFHTEISNQSNVAFQVDYIEFKIADKKLAKRTVVQQQKLIPLRIYKPLGEIRSGAKEQNVFVLDQFTLSDEKVLLIEIYEKSGNRHQVLQVENSDLVHARFIKDMHLKID